MLVGPGRASGGAIGKACPAASAAADADVRVLDRDAEAATAVTAEIGGGAHVADPADRAAPVPQFTSSSRAHTRSR